MSWFVDNANVLYVLFGIVAVGLLLIWRNNRQAKYLGFTAGVLVLIGLVWLATQFYVSDSKQIENNVNAMAEAVVAGKVDDLFKHISKDFVWKGKNRDLMYEGVKGAIAQHKITHVRISSFRAEDVSRAEKVAKTSFLVNATANKEILLRTEADFILEGEQWKLKTMRFYLPTGGQEIDLPLR
jgi:hypothetical protein